MFSLDVLNVFVELGNKLFGNNWLRPRFPNAGGVQCILFYMPHVQRVIDFAQGILNVGHPFTCADHKSKTGSCLEDMQGRAPCLEHLHGICVNSQGEVLHELLERKQKAKHELLVFDIPMLRGTFRSVPFTEEQTFAMPIENVKVVHEGHVRELNTTTALPERVAGDASSWSEAVPKIAPQQTAAYNKNNHKNIWMKQVGSEERENATALSRSVKFEGRGLQGSAPLRGKQDTAQLKRSEIASVDHPAFWASFEQRRE